MTTAVVSAGMGGSPTVARSASTPSISGGSFSGDRRQPTTRWPAAAKRRPASVPRSPQPAISTVMESGCRDGEEHPGILQEGRVIKCGAVDDFRDSEVAAEPAVLQRDGPAQH